MNWHKLINAAFVVLFAVIGVWGGFFFLELHRDLTLARAQEATNQAKLAAAQERLAKQQAYLEQLQADPGLVERVIRQKLRYARGEEFVFRFDDSESHP